MKPLFFCIFCLLLKLLNVSGSCQPGFKACEIENWSKWFSCDATCGGGHEKREKYLCCEDNVQPHTRDNCLKYCNYTLSWWDKHAVETKPCAKKCTHGRYDDHRNQCSCFSGFTGKCCDKVATTTTPTTTTTSTTTTPRTTSKTTTPTTTTPTTTAPTTKISTTKFTRAQSTTPTSVATKVPTTRKSTTRSRQIITKSKTLKVNTLKLLTTSKKNSLATLKVTKKNSFLFKKTTETLSTMISPKPDLNNNPTNTNNPRNSFNGNMLKSSTRAAQSNHGQYSRATLGSNQNNIGKATVQAGHNVGQTISSQSNTQGLTAKKVPKQTYSPIGGSLTYMPGRVTSKTPNLGTYGFNLPSGNGNQNAMSLCLRFPCEHGTCVPTSNDYICFCDLGYEGKNCDIDADNCADEPCVYGTCTDKVNGFHCECNAFFQGIKCTKMKTWAIAFISVTAAALLLTCCCLAWCISSCCRDDDPEKKKVEPLPNKPRPQPMGKPNAWMN